MLPCCFPLLLELGGLVLNCHWTCRAPHLCRSDPSYAAGEAAPGEPSRGLFQPGGEPQGWWKATPLTRPGSGRCSGTFTPRFHFPPYSLCSPGSCHRCLKRLPCASPVAPAQGQFPLDWGGRVLAGRGASCTPRFPGLSRLCRVLPAWMVLPTRRFL